jgi:hypothetical protein
MFQVKLLHSSMLASAKDCVLSGFSAGAFSENVVAL